MDRRDLAIVGAGPAGMSMALEASDLGIRTLVLDEQARPGGQIYRGADATPSATLPEDSGGCGAADRRRGRDLIRAFRNGGAEYVGGATVFQVDADGTVHFRSENRIGSVKARRLAIATGAMERPVPLPGWTLPGVMGAGSAQLLLKAEGMTPTGRVVLVGKGPLLLLLACQLQEAGVTISAFIETTTVFARAIAMLRHLEALAAPDYLGRGMGFYRRLRQGGAAVFEGARDIRVVGAKRVEGIRFVAGDRERILEADHLFVHEGVVPNVQLTRHLGCTHDWHPEQRYWRARTDTWGNTSRDGVAVVGDGAGISGAHLAEYGGRLAAVDAAYRLGRITLDERNRRTRSLRRQSRRHRLVRPFLDDLYRPPLRAIATPADDAIVCRCENVTAADLTDAVRSGIHDPNRLKFAVRCGMGPCQSRMCALTVTEVVAAAANLSVEDVGHFRIRPPIKPIGMGELAQWGLIADGGAGDAADEGSLPC